MQSPAPASNLAEARPAASPQLGRRICQHGLRSARVGCLLLVLAAASAAAVLLLLCCCCAAASTTTALALVTIRTGTVFLELVSYCIYAVSGPGKHPSRVVSGSKPTTGAVDLSAAAAIPEDPGSAAGACCCQCYCCQCCCCCCRCCRCCC